MRVPKWVDLNKNYKSNSSGEFIILKYIDNKNVLIKFLNTSCEITAYGGSVKIGNVKDPMKPSVCGVGFLGVGRYSSKSKSYLTWRNMIVRCYSKENLKRQPTYLGCSVCDEWHNFQVFSEWFFDNYPSDCGRYHLDKDIKIKGNRVYCPEACMFVDHIKNTIYSKCKSATLKSPSGEMVNINNISKFARDNNLSFGNLCSVIRGERMTHKGWELWK